jgi:hypothetical protein
LSRSDLHLHVLPFSGNNNNHYTEAYGIHPLSREEFLQMVRTFHIRHIVFFTGPEGDEGYLEQEAYGSYATALFNGSDPMVASMQSLPDGKIITLRESR